MNQQEIIEILRSYKQELDGILGRFKRSHEGYYIDGNDEGRFKEIVHEVNDVFLDCFTNGDASSRQLLHLANESMANFTGSPSYAGVENIRGYVASALIRARRNPLAIRASLESAQVTDKKDAKFIERLAERLPTIIHELSNRREGRTTLAVNDEYDLQDLFRCLLHIQFNDIRPEDPSPNYAGASSRLDFVLPEVRAVVEIKMTRHGLNAKKLGEELLIDIARYQNHPQCDSLFCIVYDPDKRIANPRGVEADIERHSEEIKVRVMVVPR